jgi:hypothetical protein
MADSEDEASASTWQPRQQYLSQYYGNRRPTFGFGTRPNYNVYEPELSAEDDQVYDPTHNHRHFYPNTFKRGYEGSGIGGMIPDEEKSIPLHSDSEFISKSDGEEEETSTLPTLIRVTRPSVTVTDK